MKSVILIGDSIRFGYAPYVRRELRGEAEMWMPQENGGTSTHVLEHLSEWVLDRDADVIHLNCGLHDLRTEFDATQQAVPLLAYRTNVETMMTRIVEHCSGKLIWATTTPVNQDWHRANKAFDRFESDVIAYNRASRDIANRLGVPIDNLFTIVQQAGRDQLLQPDGVHLQPRGYELLGRAVVDSVRSFF